MSIDAADPPDPITTTVGLDVNPNLAERMEADRAFSRIVRGHMLSVRAPPSFASKLLRFKEYAVFVVRAIDLRDSRTVPVMTVAGVRMQRRVVHHDRAEGPTQTTEVFFQGHTWMTLVSALRLALGDVLHFTLTSSFRFQLTIVDHVRWRQFNEYWEVAVPHHGNLAETAEIMADAYESGQAASQRVQNSPSGKELVQFEKHRAKYSWLLTVTARTFVECAMPVEFPEKTGLNDRQSVFITDDQNRCFEVAIRRRRVFAVIPPASSGSGGDDPGLIRYYLVHPGWQRFLKMNAVHNGERWRFEFEFPNIGNHLVAFRCD